MDYTSYVLIGCEIDPSKLAKQILQRGCECEIPNIEDVNYCPNCGAKVYLMGNEWIEGFDESEGTLFGLQLIYSSSRDRCWVAIRLTQADEYGDSAEKLIVPENITAIKEELKAKLEPRGFWDESKFGIWVVLSSD